MLKGPSSFEKENVLSILIDVLKKFALYSPLLWGSEARDHPHPGLKSEEFA